MLPKNINNLTDDVCSENITNLKDDMSAMKIKEGIWYEVIQFKTDREIDFQLAVLTLKDQGVWQCKACKKLQVKEVL